MKKKILYALWGFFYGICAYLGTLVPGTKLQGAAMTAFSLIFFLPPAVLLVIALKEKNKKELLWLRFISIGALSLTLLGFILNIAAVNASEAVGNALYIALNFMSVPMICSRHYVLSLFLWACLMFATFPKLSQPNQK